MIIIEINIRGDKIQVTPAIKTYAETKLAKIAKYFSNTGEIKITAIIRVKNDEQIIEVTVPTESFTLRAEEKHIDLYAAIDLVLDKLERQIRKNKTRIKDKYKKELSNSDSIFDFEETDENNNKIIKRKTIESKPMDEEEAILQMELLNHDFFIFNNVDENCISVLYRRKDNHYGIINTK